MLAVGCLGAATSRAGAGQLQPTVVAATSCPLCDILNRRFRTGAPSRNLEEAGVILRTLDGEESGELPWQPNTTLTAGDRLSATLANARHPDIYSDIGVDANTRERGFVGLVIKPSAEVSKRLRCAHPMDMNSLAANCLEDGEQSTGCLPGCAGGAGAECDFGEFDVCSEMSPTFNLTAYTPRQRNGWCHYPASRLREMMCMQDATSTWGKTNQVWNRHGGYNELIFDAKAAPWAGAALPALIDAVFLRAPGVCAKMCPWASCSAVGKKKPGCCCHSCGHSEEDVRFARDVQALLWREAGLQVPLLTYNASSEDMPFRLYAEVIEDPQHKAASQVHTQFGELQPC